MKFYKVLILVLLVSQSCQKENNDQFLDIEVEGRVNYIDESQKTIVSRYQLPKGFKRLDYQKNEFGFFLENLPLKSFNEKVKYFDGKTKDKKNVYSSVIDLPIGTKDLHQCADAVMRLRADFLYENKRYDEIAFNFLSDGKPRYYVDYVKNDYSREHYWDYLEYIFSFANTSSLKDQMKTINSNEIKIGDVLIQKGNPFGHAVILIDLAENNEGDKIGIFAQSYMPAQELQILTNPKNKDNSPWYDLSSDIIQTPEWKFTSKDWKTW